MPSQVALLLCTAFVLYLLRFDRKIARDVTWTLWLPTAWLLCVSSRSLDGWFGMSGDRMSGGILDPFFQTGLFVIGLMILFRRRLNWSEVFRDNGWLVVLLGYMLITVLWSDLPARTFRSWIKEVVGFVMALVIVTQPSPVQAMESVLRRTVYILIPFSVLLVKYYPALGVTYSKHTGGLLWIGVAIQKNSLGHLCLTSAFFLIWTMIARWRKRQAPVSFFQTITEFFLLAVTIWLLKGPSAWAASASSIIGLSVGLTALFLLTWMHAHKMEQLASRVWVMITAGLIVLGTITPLVGGSTVTGVTGAMGRDTTLTGRTDIWASLIPDLKKQPVLGYGFTGFWNLDRTIEHDIGEAHNGYLDVWLQLGFVGLFIVAMFLLSSAGKAQRILRNDFDYGCLNLCFVLMAVTESIAESAIDTFERQAMAIVLLVSVCGVAAVRRTQMLEQVPAYQ